MTTRPEDGAASMPIESAALPGGTLPPRGAPGWAAPAPPDAGAAPTSSPRQRYSPAAAGGSSGPAGATSSSRVAPARERAAKAPGGTARRAADPAVPLGSRPAYLRGGGTTLTVTAHCQRCDWTAGPGDAAEVDKAAAKHTEKPPKHPTVTVATLAGIRGAP